MKNYKILFNKILTICKHNLKHLKRIGKVVSVLAICFVIYTAATMIKQLDTTFISWSLVPLLLISVIICIFCNFVYAYSYHNILQTITEIKYPLKDILAMYLTSNIYKYLPSNVMHYVGRNLIAQQYQIPQKKVLLSTIYEIVNVVAVTFIYCISCWFSKINILLIVPIYIISIAVAKIFKMSKSFILISSTTLLNNIIVVALYNFYTMTILGTDFTQISLYQSVSWLVGFLTPGAPGGIGIKEMVLIKLGTSDLIPALTAVAIMQRLILISGDILAFLAAKFLTKRSVITNE